MSVEEYREKRQGKQFAEAKTLVQEYRNRFGKTPSKDVLAEYFMLFSTAEQASEYPVFCTKMSSGGNYEETVAYMHEHHPMFESYEVFLQACGE